IPLAFLIDIKEDTLPLKRFTDALKSVFLLFVKSLAVILGIITFLINFAGGWVGVYPLGGQNMIDPIWGSFDQGGVFIAGHLENLFSWINIVFDFNGKLSLELFQGHYAGGFKLNLLFVGVSLDIHHPAASTLALFEIWAFCAIIFLILLINPYYSINNVRQFFAGKFKPFFAGKNPKKILKRYTLIELSLLIIFILWIVMDLFRILGIPVQSFVVDVLTVLNQVNLEVASIPGINFLAQTIYFIVFSVGNFLFLRTDFLSIQTWFFNSLLFILVTSVAWLPYTQIQKFKENKKTEEREEFQAYWIESEEFRLFHWISRFLAGLYIIQSFVTIIFANSGSTIYSEFSVIFYILIFTIIISTIIFPLSIDISKAMVDIPVVNESNKSDDNFAWNKTLIASIMLLFIVIIFLFKIVMQLIGDKIPLSDFLIIRPSLDNISIQDWFFQGKNGVPIFLTIFVILLLVVALALFLPELTKKRRVPSVVPLLPSEFEERLQNEGKSLSGFQSTLIFGGYITFFLYFLITVLYSALSSVPNPS
ncbi:MAG: hypothetical protein KAT16_10260, partial [Candidatus Heimdallarchaeota archaeon]|nr:hypothetical protein [Candidatus Heimdallarchaeota archaeon]